jgi:oxygen-independent coproporphyrinogen-3 oxidase
VAGLYLHIPFCRKNCSYCDFYFSLNKKHEPAFFNALRTELALRKFEISGESIDTVYFGGGTPSYASPGELERVLDLIRTTYIFSGNPEITLEANPDDLTRENLNAWKQAGINRLSIGVQSFDDRFLELLGRRHDSRQVFEGLEETRAVGFENITIDLIYGIPGMYPEDWQKQVEIFSDLDIPHLSAYALTVEPRTLLSRRVEKGIVRLPDDEIFETMFLYVSKKLDEAGYEHYEISNWAKPGYRSRHNTSYWQGKMYMGFGPSAYSYDGYETRRWNVANLHKYIKGITGGTDKWYETEQLSGRDLYNELIMTRLRLLEGVREAEVEKRFPVFVTEFRRTAQMLKERGLLEKNGGYWRIPGSKRFLSDGIIEEFFSV